MFHTFIRDIASAQESEYLYAQSHLRQEPGQVEKCQGNRDLTRASQQLGLGLEASASYRNQQHSQDPTQWCYQPRGPQETDKRFQCSLSKLKNK